MDDRRELKELYKSLPWHTRLELAIRIRMRLMRPQSPSHANTPRIAKLAARLMLTISAISGAFAILAQDVMMLILPVFFFLYTALVLVIRQVHLKAARAA